MNSKRRVLTLFAILLSVNLFVIGCEITKDEMGKTHLRLNPDATDNIERGGEVVVGASEVLAPLLGPAGGLIAGGLATGLALFKKYKPALTKSQTMAEMSNTVASISVDTFETLKKEYPEIWAKCAEKIHAECTAANIDTKMLENFIRGLRGLPAKS